jgi:hypothetical protein
MRVTLRGRGFTTYTGISGVEFNVDHEHLILYRGQERFLEVDMAAEDNVMWEFQVGPDLTKE